MALIKESSGRTRATDIRAGVRVETISVVWMIVEAIAAIAAGVIARSVLLTAFGIDSVIEVVSAFALLWRLSTEAHGDSLERVEHVEHRATWITGGGLALLCGYVVVSSGLSLLTRTEPAPSYVGIVLAVAAVIIMPLLVWRKRGIADRIGSSSLKADAACSMTCAYMAGTLLVGLALNAILHWWWTDAVAALTLLYWLIPETREALEAAREGHGRCECSTEPA
jgi:divalent metal cation (Fe/Co/Zn/Cd) transporter